MTPQNDRDFFERHGPCVRHPDTPRLWIFADGATLLEAAWRGGSEAKEPSPDPVVRIEVQLKYFDVAYTAAWKEFNRCERTCDIDGIRQKGEALKAMHQRMTELSEEWNSLSEIKARRLEDDDREMRELIVEQVKWDRERKLKEEAQRVAAEVRSTLPSPPAEVSQEDVYTRFAPPTTTEAANEASQQIIAALTLDRTLAGSPLLSPRRNRG